MSSISGQNFKSIAFLVIGVFNGYHYTTCFNHAPFTRRPPPPPPPPRETMSMDSSRIFQVFFNNFQKLLIYFKETDAITKLITDNEIKAILIDEYDVLEQEIQFEGIKQKSNTRKGIMEKLLNSTEITWIALRHTGQEKDEIKEMTKMNYGIHIEPLELATNMRNSKEIVNYTRENDVFKGDIDYDFMSPPDNFPSGCTPVIKKNFEEALVTAKESTKGGIVVVLVNRTHENVLTFFYNIYKKGKDTVKAYMESHAHEYYTNIPFEKLKVDLKKGINGNITDSEIKTFNRYISNAFKSDGKNPYAFLLENSGGDGQNILVTIMSNIDGFEWNTIIFDGDKYPDQISGNKLVRCTVNIIIAEQFS